MGVFLTVLIYPIEDGVISKSVMNLAKTFVNGILNKKFFLKGENLLKKESEEEKMKEKKAEKKPKKKRKIIQHKNNMINFSNKLRNPKKWKEKNEYNYLLEKEKMEQKLKIFNQSLASKNEYSDRIRNKIMKKNKKSKEKNNRY